MPQGLDETPQILGCSWRSLDHWHKVEAEVNHGWRAVVLGRSLVIHISSSILMIFRALGIARICGESLLGCASSSVLQLHPVTLITQWQVSQTQRPRDAKLARSAAVTSVVQHATSVQYVQMDSCSAGEFANQHTGGIGVLFFSFCSGF